MSALYEALGLLEYDGRYLDVLVRRLVECRCDDLCAYAALHVGDLLRTLIDEQYDEVYLRVIGRYSVGDVFEYGGLTYLRLCYDSWRRCPLPIGVKRSMILVLSLVGSVNSVSFSSGNSGVR
jgi:hypothetical protein